MNSGSSALLAQANELDQLLDEALGDARPSQAQDWDAILQRNGVEFDGYAPLDTRDQVVALVAGLVGGVLDLTNAFRAGLTNEGGHQRFDALSKEYLEKITGQSGIAAIDNHRGGRAHRLIGPAHDLTRFFEALGQMMNGRFESNFGGVFKSAMSYRDGCSDYLKIESPVEATILLLLHLIGDFFSAQSLPIPGRSKLAEIHDPEIYRAIVKEFLNGENLRGEVSKFLSTLSGAVLIALIIRLYRYYVIFVVERQPVRWKCLSLANDISFHLMQRNAQTLSFVISAAKAGFTANPLELNYASFIQIVRSGASVNRLSAEECRLLDARFERVKKEIEEF